MVYTRVGFKTRDIPSPERHIQNISRNISLCDKFRIFKSRRNKHWYYINSFDYYFNLQEGRTHSLCAHRISLFSSLSFLFLFLEGEKDSFFVKRVDPRREGPSLNLI